MENRRPKEAAAAYRKAYDTGDPAVRKAARHELRTRFYRHPESDDLFPEESVFKDYRQSPAAAP